VRLESVWAPGGEGDGRDTCSAADGSAPPEVTDYLTRCVCALARLAVVLAKSAEPEERQMAALQSFADLAARGSFALRFYEDVLRVDGHVIPTSDPRMAELAYRLAAQSVAEIAVARGAEPIELLALAKGLAEPPGSGRLKTRLRDAGSTRVMVVLAPQLDASDHALNVREAFAKLSRDEGLRAEWERFLLHGRESAVDRQVDFGLARRGGDDGDGPTAQPGAAPAGTAAQQAAGPERAVSLSPGPPTAAESHGRPTLQTETPLSIALAQLLANPYGQEALPLLNRLVRQIEGALEDDCVAEAIDACCGALELETRAPAGLRDGYAAIIRRLLYPQVLERVAPYLLDSRRGSRAMAILRRAGEVAVGLLVELLAAGVTVGERRAYVDALRELPRGLERAAALLCRPDWHAVRNAAEALGEGHVAVAATYLARLLEHEDVRVRRASLVALARIGSTATVAPLREFLLDGPPELCVLVASSIGGEHASALIGLLADVLEREGRAEVIVEYCRALGRIGTPDARRELERLAARRSLLSRRARLARRAAREVLSESCPGPRDATTATSSSPLPLFASMPANPQSPTA
jgi:hypothetical protein